MSTVEVPVITTVGITGSFTLGLIYSYSMKGWTLHKVQVLVFLLDVCWKPGIEIRAKQVERELYRLRGIELDVKTVYSVLDALVEDRILLRSPQGREKFYSINEELQPGDLRMKVIAILGMQQWVRPTLVNR